MLLSCHNWVWVMVVAIGVANEAGSSKNVASLEQMKTFPLSQSILLNEKYHRDKENLWHYSERGLHSHTGLDGSEEKTMPHGKNVVRTSKNYWRDCSCSPPHSTTCCALNDKRGSDAFFEGQGRQKITEDSESETATSRSGGNLKKRKREFNEDPDLSHTSSSTTRSLPDQDFFSLERTDVVEFLTEELHVAKEHVDKVLRGCPQLLRLSVHNNLRPAARHLMSRGLSARDIGKAVVTWPKMMSHHSSHNAGAVMEWLQDLGVPSDKIAKIVVARPQLLALSVSNNLNPKMAFLVDEAKVPRTKLARLFVSAPSVLTLSVEKKLRPTCQYLIQDISIPMDKLGTFICFFPQILCFSIENKLKPTVDYLVSVIGIPRHKVATVVCKKPQLLGYLCDKMQRTVAFLRDEVGISDEGIRDMVVRFPALLGYSVDANLRPTLFCLREGTNLTTQDLVAFPQMLSYSLEKRVKPRLEHLRGRGIHIKDKGSLASMLRATDSIFVRRHGEPKMNQALEDAGGSPSKKPMICDV